MERYTIDLADEVVKNIDAAAARLNVSRTEAFKRALALIPIANEAHESDSEIGVIRCDKNGAKVVALIDGV
jgi:metal-responsive CopG/Arc/MetJ family transcriptional regulator